MSMREGVAVPKGLTTGNVQRRVAREHEVRIWGSHDITLHASDRFPEITTSSTGVHATVSRRQVRAMFGTSVARKTQWRGPLALQII
jgi:hypothetical protein